MKNWFAVGSIFLCSYMVFIVATIPLAFVVNHIELPNDVTIEKVSGSIWQGEISQLSIGTNNVKKIETSLSFWSLFVLSPTVDVSFGDALSTGPEGKFTLTVSSDELSFSDVALFVSANNIAKNLRLPVPATAQGSAEITFTELIFNTSEKISCERGVGQVNWKKAGVIALDNTIKVGDLSAEIACEKGDMTAKISPKNNLGLDLEVSFDLAKQKPSGLGFVKPGAKFPEALKPALSFIGRADNQGRYVIKF